MFCFGLQSDDIEIIDPKSDEIPAKIRKLSGDENNENGFTQSVSESFFTHSSVGHNLVHKTASSAESIEGSVVDTSVANMSANESSEAKPSVAESSAAETSIIESSVSETPAIDTTPSNSAAEGSAPSTSAAEGPVQSTSAPTVNSKPDFETLFRNVSKILRYLSDF